MPTTEQPRAPLRRIGALWKPRKPHSGRTLLTGVVTIGGLRQRFVVVKNDRKQRENDPDYAVMSSDEPERDPYAARASTPTRPDLSDDIAF